MIKRLFLFLLLVSAAYGSYAIDPNVASFSIMKKNGKWFLEMVCAPASLERAVKTASAIDGKLNSENRDHQQAISDYFKQTVHVVVNEDAQLTLKEETIKITGSRATVRFLVDGMPDQIGLITVRIRTMSDNEDQVNLVKIVAGEQIGRLLLDRSNNYEQQADLSEQTEQNAVSEP